MVMQGDDVFMEGKHLPVLKAPGKRPAVVRIREAAESDFVSVIKSRRAGPGHLHNDRFPHDSRPDTL